MALVERLEEYTAALNLPTTAFTRQERDGARGQLPLIPRIGSIVLVVGKTCAGKTTFGAHVENRHQFRWIEASSVVRLLGEEVGRDEGREPVLEFARRLMKVKGAEVVARKCLQLVDLNQDVTIVITGFRTLEEIELIQREVEDTTVILVESTERTRFERYLARARSGSESKLGDFRAIDQDQVAFGLLRVAEDFADIRIRNEGTMEEYLQQIDSIISEGASRGRIGIANRVHSTRLSMNSQLSRCLLALERSGRAMDCSEIEGETADTGRAIRFNNVNKILKRFPELAQRIELGGENVRYSITSSGRTYLRLLERRRQMLRSKGEQTRRQTTSRTN